MRILLSLFLLSFSASAFAFPVAGASLVNSIPLFIAILAGSGARSIKLKGALFIVLILSIFYLAFNAELNNKFLKDSLESDTNYIDLMVSKNEKENIFILEQSGFFVGGIDKSKDFASLFKNVNLFMITGTDKFDSSISGFPIINSRDDLKKSIKEENDALIVYSNVSSLKYIVDMKNELRDLNIPVFVLLYENTLLDISLSNLVLSSAGDLSNVGIFNKQNEDSSLYNYQRVEDYNLIVLLDSFYFARGSVLNGVHIDRLSMALDIIDWNKISEKIDPKKDNLILYTSGKEISPKELLDTASLISKKLSSKNKTLITNNNIRLSVANWANEVFISKPFKNSDKFLLPNDVFTKLYLSKSKVICFTNKCIDDFPKEYVEYIPDGLNYNNGLTINKEKFNNLDKKYNYILASNSLLDFSTAYHVGNFLFEKGFVIDGFTYQTSMYFSNIFTYKDHFKAEDDLTLISIQLKMFFAKHLDFKPMEISFLTICFVMLMLGIASIYIKNKKASLAISFISIFILLFQNELFLYPAEYYANSLFKMSDFEILFALYLVFAFRFKSIYMLAIMFIMLTVEVKLSMIETNLGILYLMPIALFSFFNFLRDIYNLNQNYLSKNISEKASLTLPFVEQKYKGIILDSRSEIGFLNPAFDLWILRSNHNIEEENKLAGIYSSFMGKREEMPEIFKRELDYLINFSGEGKILKSNIQFWLQPYIEADSYGVASSHSLDDEKLFNYSLGDADSVTEGITSEITYIDRIAQESIKNKIFKKVKSIEKSLSMPVVVEFAIKDDKIFVLQVREQNLPSYFDKDICKELREIKLSDISGRLSNLDTSPFGKSVVYRLYSNSILPLNDELIILKRNKINDYDEKIINKVISDLMSYSKELSTKTKNASLEVIIDVYAKILGPLKFKKEALSKNLSLMEIFSYQLLHRSVFNSGKSLINDLDAGSGFIDISEVGNIEINFKLLTKNELIHMIYAYAVNKIALFAEDTLSLKRTEYNLSLTSFIAGEKPLKPRLSKGNKNKENIIFDGDFSGWEVGIEKYLLLSEKEKSEVILVGDHIPTIFITHAMKAKAIILNKGNELSHISITAQALGVPLKIIG